MALKRNRSNIINLNMIVASEGITGRKPKFEGVTYVIEA